MDISEWMTFSDRKTISASNLGVKAYYHHSPLAKTSGKREGKGREGWVGNVSFFSLFFLSLFFLQFIYIGIMNYHILHKNWNSDFSLLIINSNYTYNSIRRTKWSLFGDGFQSTGCLDWSVSNTRSRIPPYLCVDHVEHWINSKYSQKGTRQSLCWGDFWSKLKLLRTITLSKSCLGSLSTWCCNWYKNGCLGPSGGRYINTNKTRSFSIFMPTSNISNSSNTTSKPSWIISTLHVS